MRYVWGVLAVSALFAGTGNVASAQLGGVVDEAGGAVQSGASAGVGAAGQAGAHARTDATAPVPNVPQAAGSVDTTIQTPAGQRRLNADANAGGSLNPNEQRLGVNPHLDVTRNPSNPNAHLNATGQLNANDGVRSDGQIQGNVGGSIGVNGNNRYRRHNGEWWYWTPAGSWVYYREGRWNPYVAGSFVQPHIFFGYSNGYNNGYNGGYSGNGYNNGNRYYNNDGRYRSGYRGYGNQPYRTGPAVRGGVNIDVNPNGVQGTPRGAIRGTQDATRGAIRGTQDATRDAVNGTQGAIQGTDNAVRGATDGAAGAAGNAGGAVGDAAGGLLP